MVSNLRSWLVLAAAALPIGAQLTSSLCPTVTLSATDFEATELFNRHGDNGATKDADLTEPVHFDVRVVNNASGKYDHSDIIFVERLGNLKYYDGGAKTVKVIGAIPVHATPGPYDDNGLMGVVFDPNYETNHWIYLWYSPKQTYQKDNVTPGGALSNRQLRLSRFTLKTDNTLDMASEKSLIKILASTTDMYHSGGPMQFDAYNDLWIAIGNNSHDLTPGTCDKGGSVLSQTDSAESAEWGSSNTHSMRGGFIRIHPDDAAPKGYTIPSGNFGQYWADKFEQQGKPASLVAQYRDTSKVLAEVYVKGERSNFSCAVHPTKRWLAWGTVNWDVKSDEYNITKHPIFSGFPYFHADNQPTCAHGKNPQAPTNNSTFNSGVVDLPPAIGGTLNWSTTNENVAIGGPIYSFDPSLDNDFKFPPHFDNHWFVGSFLSSHYYVATVDTSSDTLKTSGSLLRLDQTGLLKNASFRNYLQSMFGKDGALYILNYSGQNYASPTNPGVVRVIYKGACHVPVSAQKVVARYQSIWIDPHGITIKELGPHVVALYDLNGHLVWSEQGMGPRDYRIGEIHAHAGMRAGIYLAKVNTPAGEVSRRISVF